MDKPGPVKAATLAGKHSSNPSQSLVSEPNENVKSQNQYLSGSSSRKKSADSKVIVDPAPSAKVVNGDTSASLTDTKDIDKHNMGNLQSKNHSGKLKDPSGPSDILPHRHHDKSGFLQQSGRQLKNVDDLEASNRSKEKSNIREVPDLNMPDGRHAIEISVGSLLFSLFSPECSKSENFRLKYMQNGYLYIFFCFLNTVKVLDILLFGCLILYVLFGRNLHIHTGRMVPVLGRKAQCLRRPLGIWRR